MKLFLVRHGETVWNQQRRAQGGLSDIPLDSKGEQQALRLGQALQGEGLEAIYSSPLSRAYHTAQAIASPLSLPVQTVPELREIDAGEADGLSFELLPQKYPDFWREWRQGTGSIRWPGGESLEEVRDRTWPVVVSIGEKHPQGTVAIVAHTFIVVSIVLKALELPPGLFRRLRLEPASLSLLHFGPDGARLLRFNDACHLQGL